MPTATRPPHGDDDYHEGDGDQITLNCVTLADFAAVDEPGVDALLGGDGEALIPANGDVMVYGDGGAGKTTLCLDLACHLAAGDDWLGIPIATAINVLLVENEGPRPLFRAKARAKLAAWTGSPLDDRVRIVDEPWATFTFAAESHRVELARPHRRPRRRRRHRRPARHLRHARRRHPPRGPQVPRPVRRRPPPSRTPRHVRPRSTTRTRAARCRAPGKAPATP